jgi:hypothetical protein
MKNALTEPGIQRVSFVTPVTLAYVRKRPLPAPEEPRTIGLGEPIKRPYRRGRVATAR